MIAGHMRFKRLFHIRHWHVYPDRAVFPVGCLILKIGINGLKRGDKKKTRHKRVYFRVV